MEQMTHAIDGAKLIGFDNNGRACVWFGGYGFNVYDAAGDWNEIRAFTSGEMMRLTDRERLGDEGKEYAAERMENEGFDIIR